jgi:Na+-translocating ferredoxin:NAD+ oxidoreductase RnfG subunit
MKKITLLMFLFILAGTGLFAQQSSGTKQILGKDPNLMKNSALKELADQVNKNYQLVQTSATMSRAGAQKVNEDFASACRAYIGELKKQLADNQQNAIFVKALESEISDLGKIFPVENETIKNNKPKN